ncbi:MAG: response regulator transcription factor [Bdellovibrionales bacterium]|nr:response regulator transcription factor [Bdellovibrionales bacterium]
MSNDSRNLIWILEDDPECVEIYKHMLGEKYALEIFGLILEFKAALKNSKKKPDLLVTDLRLPDGNFLDYLTGSDDRSLPSCPLLVVSSLDDQSMLETAYAEGALDYLIKPFRKTEALVKISRHLDSGKSKIESFGYSLDHFKHGLTKNGSLVVGLTPKEQQIFAVLQSHNREGITKSDIVRIAWSGQVMYEKSFDVHLFNLRKKLREYTNLTILQIAGGRYQLALSDGVKKPD